MSKLAQSPPPSSHDRGLQVPLQTRSITASKYIFKERRWVYRDTGVTEVDRVTGSIYSADPGLDRHHLISILSHHITIIHTLSFPTFGLTRFVRDFGSAQLRGSSTLGSIISSHAIPMLLEPEMLFLLNSVCMFNGRVLVLLRLCSSTICGQIDRMYIYRET